MRKWMTVALLVSGVFGCKSKEEQLKEAEEDAKFKADMKGAMVKGVGEALQGSGQEGMQALSKGLGDVVKGAAKGFDASLDAVQVKPAQTLTDKGMRVERASRRAAAQAGQPAVITAYVLSDKDYKGTLMLRALDDGGKEVGRSKAEVTQKPGDAAYVDFPFDERVPLNTISTFEISAL